MKLSEFQKDALKFIEEIVPVPHEAGICWCPEGHWEVYIYGEDLVGLPETYWRAFHGELYRKYGENCVMAPTQGMSEETLLIHIYPIFSMKEIFNLATTGRLSD